MSEHYPPSWPAHILERGAPPLPAEGLELAIARQLKLSPENADSLCKVYRPLAAYCATRVSEGRGHSLILGVNGAQGTGKSTAAHILKAILAACHGLNVCVMSIDDLYLTRAQRENLAAAVHPLLETRGVPGTHDLPLALEVFQRLQQARAGDITRIPRFDKSVDDRCPPEDWEAVTGCPDVIIFEGWCVGARPQRLGDLEQAVNALEAEEDPGGVWRRYVNTRLTDYQQLFSQLDLLVMLKAPSFAQVLEWRQLQEQKLRDTLTPEMLASSRLMSGPQIERFIAHYERLTRWMLREMPARADVLFELAQDHQIATIDCHLSQ